MLDTAALVSALRSGRGAAAEVVRLALLGKLVLLMDYKLALEYRDVGCRPEHLAASGSSDEEITRLLDVLEAVAEPVLVVTRHRPLSQDPNDDMVLDLAINGDASAIITSNVRHFRAAAARFDIPVLRPAELLERLREEE